MEEGREEAVFQNMSAGRETILEREIQAMIRCYGAEAGREGTEIVHGTESCLPP